MKNYVSKLIDRNLQRKRESGFTTYALYSILILIAYKMTELYHVLPFKKSLFDTLSLIVCALNIYFFLIIIIMIYSSSNKYKSVLILKLKSNDDSLLYDIISSSIFIIPLILCIGVTINNYYLWKQNTYFIIMSIIHLIIFFSIALLYRSEQKKTNKAIEISGGNKENSDKDAFSKFSYFLSFSIILYSFFTLYNFETTISKVNVLVFSILLYSIPCILNKIMDLNENDDFTLALENLEYEINLLKLEDDDIRIRLQQNYYGFLIKEWISYNTQLLETLILDQSKKISIIEKLENDLTKIDKIKNPIDYNNYFQKIIIEKKYANNDLSKFCYQKIIEITSFWNNEEIESDDKKDLLKLYSRLKNNRS